MVIKIIKTGVWKALDRKSQHSNGTPYKYCLFSDPDVDMDPIHPNSSQNPMIIDDGLDTPEGDSDTIEDLAHSMHNKYVINA